MEESNPLFRMMIALALILALMVIVVLVSPQKHEGKLQIEKGSIGVVIRPTYLYEKGSEKSTAIKELPKGTSIVLLSANLWMYQVEMDNGEKAWVKAEDIEVKPPAKQ